MLGRRMSLVEREMEMEMEMELVSESETHTDGTNSKLLEFSFG